MNVRVFLLPFSLGFILSSIIFGSVIFEKKSIILSQDVLIKESNEILSDLNRALVDLDLSIATVLPDYAYNEYYEIDDMTLTGKGYHLLGDSEIFICNAKDPVKSCLNNYKRSYHIRENEFAVWYKHR